ncbi:MAG TPA: GTPase HflX [Jatrophihabitans sp.]|nr:GTPase HflX [Jatrophihabitans sp.]
MEIDRRRINARMSKLRRDLAAMKTARDVKRARRDERQIPSVVLAGYTNAGKSSLLNRLTDAGVLVENALFATLDPTVRRCETADGRVYTLADTVGFVRHLPTQLVEAFRSTLEEVADADLILHVVDASDADPEAQIAAVREVLADIEAVHVTEQLVFNKIDAAAPETLLRLRALAPDAMFVSARTGEGMAQLRAVLDRRLPRLEVEVSVLVPYTRGELVARLHERGEILHTEHTASGTVVQARVDPGLAEQLRPYDRVIAS